MTNPAPPIGAVTTPTAAPDRVQARAHLSALADAYPLETVLIFGRGQDNIDRMTDLAQSLGLAGRQAPFLNAGALQPGAFATITDLAEPWQQDSLDGRDRIVIDDAEQERTADVKLVRPDLVHGDLSDLVLGRVPGREGAGEGSAFIFRGYGLADLAIASLALVAAEKQMSVR